MRKKLLSMLLVLAMVLTMMPTSVTAAAKETTHGMMGAQAIDQNKLVRAIVVMDGAPLLEQGYTVGTTAKQAKAQAKADTMIQKQDALFAKIRGGQTSTRKEAGKQTVSIKMNYHFTLTLNGMSITVPYGKLAQIRKMDGVKAVFVARQYHVVQPKTQESGKMVGREETWANGYTGKGMKIAVLDTGINVSHPVFKALPESKLTEASVTKDSLQKQIDACGMELHATESNGGTLTADDVYRNTKIPFGYNYADEKLDIEHHDGSDHGTHVAGIAAGNKTVTKDGTVVGVAPDAQIMVFRVLGSDGSGSEDSILAAIDDALLLKADVINMSLGATAGFSLLTTGDTAEDQNTIDWINRAYNNVEKTDTLLEVAAGNEGSSAQGGLWDQYYGIKKNSSDNTDIATVGDSSTFAASMSVASVNNKEMMAHFMTAGGKTITYNDSLVEKTFMSLAGKTYRFAMVGNLGKTVGDFKKAGVKGKIAVVQRGEITFVEKQANALAAGAVGCIIYNNSPDGILGMIVEENLPCVAISMSDGKYLESLAKKGTNKITISKNGKFISYDGAGELSDFSSWGVTPDLQLKPEITAPGGNIYSSTNNGRYEVWNGTSMATPHAAGVAALIKQKLEADGVVLATGQLRKRIDALMMSTATPVLYNQEEKIPFSPRKQGAGLVNAYQSIIANAYLTVGNNGRPKISLGDDVSRSGKYRFTFTVNNTSDHSLTFTPETSVMTDDIIDYQEEGIPTFLSETPRLLKEAKVEYSGAAYNKGVITVGPKSTNEITVAVTLTQEEKDQLTAEFKNGIYVEGFVRLIANEAEEVSLTLPYMGYYGDWTDADLFDSCFTDDYVMAESGLYGEFAGEKYQGQLGLSVNNNSSFQRSHVVISPNGDGYLDELNEIDLSLLRNAKVVTAEFKNHDTGEVYTHGTQVSHYTLKSFLNEDYGIAIPNTYLNGFDFKDDKGELLPSGTNIDLVVTGEVDYSKHSASHENTFTLPMVVDTKEPEADLSNVTFTKNAKNGKATMTITLTDDTYLSDVEFGKDNFRNVLGLGEFKDEDFKETADGNQTITKTFDITGYGNNFQMILEDYGYNRTLLNVDVSKKTVTKAEAPKDLVIMPSMSGAVGWEAILDSLKGQIKDAAGADVAVSIDMGSATVLPKAVLKAITKKAVALTATLEDGTSYTINGKDVKAAQIKDTQLQVIYEATTIPESKITKIAGKHSYVQMKIDASYKIPATLATNIASIKDEKDANACLYRYNTTEKKLVFVGTSPIDENGNVSFTIKRGGNYVLISGKKK